jgi:hypothetical protein
VPKKEATSSFLGGLGSYFTKKISGQPTEEEIDKALRKDTDNSANDDVVTN